MSMTDNHVGEVHMSPIMAQIQRSSHGLVRSCTANVTATLTAGPATEKSLTLILPRFQVRLRLH